MQGELAALADWGVVLQVVYILSSYQKGVCYRFYFKLWQQSNNPKIPQFCRPCVKGGGFRKKTGGIDLGTTNWFVREFSIELATEYKI